jgi:hypothetical protein
MSTFLPIFMSAFGTKPQPAAGDGLIVVAQL